MVHRAWALALLPVCAAAAAEVTHEAAQQTYTVRITPGQSLRDAINAATPIHQDGKRFHGYTAWNVDWQFWWHSDASGQCRITRVHTQLATTVQMPQLQGGTADQQAAFERYAKALRQHEEGHVQWGQKAAQAIDQGIAKLPEAANCSALEQNANALGQRLLQAHVEREKEYDRSTRNGATQGAQLDD